MSAFGTFQSRLHQSDKASASHAVSGKRKCRPESCRRGRIQCVAAAACAQALERPWDEGGLAAADDLPAHFPLDLDIAAKAQKVQQDTGAFRGESRASVRDRLQAVLTLIPAMAGRVAFHNASELAYLMANPETVAYCLLRLHDLLPGENVDDLVATDARFLHRDYVDALPEEFARVVALLGIPNISSVFRKRPLLINSREVEAALDDLCAAVPQGYDARRMLLETPYLVYPANREQVRQMSKKQWGATP